MGFGKKPGYLKQFFSWCNLKRHNLLFSLNDICWERIMYEVGFSMFNTIHVDFLYLSIKEAKAPIFLMVPYPRTKTSSTKRVWVTSWVLETLIAFINLFSFALWIIMLTAYATNRKMKGERGHPCLKTLEGQKNLVGDPFIKTTKEVDCRQPIIHSTTSRATPILINSSLTKIQPTPI